MTLQLIPLLTTHIWPHNSSYELGQSWHQAGHFDLCGFTDMILCGVEIGKRYSQVY